MSKDDDRNLKVVISPMLATQLCNLGYPVVKMKMKRRLEADAYNCGVVFLFEETDAFLNDFHKLLINKGEKNGK